MAIGLQHRPLSQQLILVVSLILLLVFSILTGAVSYFGQKMAQEKAQAAMVSDAQMMRGILDAYFDNVKERGARQLQFFERWLGGTITADPNTLVKTGNKELPQIKLGDVVLNGNTDLMARFRDLTGDDTAVLQLHDGLFYRTATLLKKDGVAMNGTSLPKDDPVPATLTQGKDYSGLVERNGKYYFSTVRALKDSQGKVFGGLSVRIALDGELAQIRQLLSSRSIGKTGYPFLMHPSSEEKGIARFVLHPRFQDKTVVEAVSDQPTQDALRKMISDKQGMIRYLLADPKSGDLLEKVVAVETSEKWNWVLAFGTWTHEFNEDTVVLRNIMMVISLCAGVLSALLILLVIRQRLKPLSEMVTAVERMGMGDLHVRVSNAEANSGNEVLRLGAALNETVNKVAGLVNQANGCAQQIASSSAQLETAAQYVLDSSSQQSSSATEIAAAIEQMSANIARVAEHASRAATLSSTARETTQEGRNVVQNTVSDMETIASDIRASAEMILSLGERSRQVSSIVDVIRDIAEQTNLLALNAAIEAARAGEMGRGFAVVADEVRKLAERTAISTQEITGTIQAIVTETQQAAERMGTVREQVSTGVSSAQQANKTLGVVDTQTADAVAVVKNIASDMQEQSHSSQAIAEHVGQIASMAQANTDAAQGNRESAHALQQVSKELIQALGQFKF